MKSNYPESFDSIGIWAKTNNLKPSEARVRFAQGSILSAIANSRSLKSILVFKGGNALDFVWQPNRSTEDLDFSSEDSSLDEAQLEKKLTDTLTATGRKLGISFRINSIKRQPPGPGKTYILYAVKIGYALPDDQQNRDRIERQEPSKAIVLLEISLNECICESTLIDFGAGTSLKVSTREDIVAEKLRALLQQALRNRTRQQDLLDIAVLIHTGAELDRKRISEYLLLKAKARNVPVSKQAFQSPEIRDRARSDYDALESSTRRLFIPFEESWELLMGLVARLDIPDQSTITASQ
ncbi:nucleotidyl transferase AbiEii/AbiGii toxin family protein [Corallococcus exercitus]|uniref:Nucleotidyl transferase AbiEii/AbiGii toxin family protein n=1 Tax=Corallococcus exercitus TaxID=2316736 RepID=A0A7Y4JQQ4_9BACT|nr:nucleotidyl transferase AbiEii/AbiGii toxin family protein [Corallococcus exercitus]NOK09440.1 nucleotidyl transferase AbiEii/AbiGii toxin family protein [Corallococcus exercitus]